MNECCGNWKDISFFIMIQILSLYVHNLSICTGNTQTQGKHIMNTLNNREKVSTWNSDSCGPIVQKEHIRKYNRYYHGMFSYSLP